MRLIRGTEPGSSAMMSDDERCRYQLERVVRRADGCDCTGLGALVAGSTVGIPVYRSVDGVCPHDGWPCDPRIKRRLVACGLNPSVADAFRLDRTCARMIGFAREWGCALYTMTNAYPWRDTKPENMWAAEARGERIGGESWPGVANSVNDGVIRTALTQLLRDGGVALACWGKHAKPLRALQLERLAAEVGVRWQCLGTNKDGSPRHPLYVPAGTALRPWPDRYEA